MLYSKNMHNNRIHGGTSCCLTMLNRIALGAAALMSVTATLTAQESILQEEAQRQEIVIFRLDHYGIRRDLVEESENIINRGIMYDFDYTIPPESSALFGQTVMELEQQIRDIFIGLGRFDLVERRNRLNYQNADALLEVLKEVREQSIEIPETLVIGPEALSGDDITRVMDGFILVIPTITQYRLIDQNESPDEEYWNAEIEVAFSFIDLPNLETVAQFVVRGQGESASEGPALANATTILAERLNVRLRSQELLRLRTVILELDGDVITLALGRNMGIVPGDEYTLTRPVTLPTGEIRRETIGLLKIATVHDDFSIAQILYSDHTVTVADQLDKIDLIGFETDVYVNLMIDTTFTDFRLVPGVRFHLDRWVYRVRPLAGIEFPFAFDSIGSVVPIVAYIGAEIDWHIGRLRIAPSITFGAQMTIPLSPEFTGQNLITHLGGSGQIELSLRVDAHLIFGLNLGYAHWARLIDPTTSGGLGAVFNTYGGLIGGINVTLK